MCNAVTTIPFACDACNVDRPQRSVLSSSLPSVSWDCLLPFLPTTIRGYRLAIMASGTRICLPSALLYLTRCADCVSHRKAGRRKIRTHGFPSDGQVDRLPKLAMTAKIPPYLSLRTSLYLGYQRKKRSGAHRSAMSSCQKLQWRRKAMQQQYYVDSMSHITDREQANRQIEIVRFLRTICLLGKHPIPARSHRRQDLVKSSRLRPLQYVPPA